MIVARRLIGAGLWLASFGCSASLPEPVAAPTADAMHYRVVVSDDLSKHRVHVCFDGRVPPRLACGVGWGEEFLTAVVAVNARGAQRPLPWTGGSIDLSSVRRDECVVYEVDVDGATSYGAFRAERFGGATLTTIPLWLWRPPSRVAVDRVDVRFELPDGAEVSVPWPREGDVYRLDETAFGFKSYAAIGRFERERIRVGGAQLDIVVLDGLPAERRAHVVPWLRTAAEATTLLSGRFPRDRAQVIVVPGGRSSEPVGFGMATRGGGASLAIRLNRGADLQALRADWVAVHEFSHLFQPFVERDDAWLSEGTATYYQEVLRARAGLKSPQAAWRRIWDGSLERRWAEGSLAQESVDVFLNLRFPTVYWAGAAVALMGDVELRRRSDGRQSLDTVLTELSACCSRTRAPWSAERVVKRMDRIAGLPVFEELVRTRVQAPELPDLSELYARLGILIEGDAVRFDDGAPLAAIREAIMAPRATHGPP